LSPALDCEDPVSDPPISQRDFNNFTDTSSQQCRSERSFDRNPRLVQPSFQLADKGEPLATRRSGTMDCYGVTKFDGARVMSPFLQGESHAEGVTHASRLFPADPKGDGGSRVAGGRQFPHQVRNPLFL
jgi:hypothetical protein